MDLTYPPAALEILAEHNGVRVDQLPREAFTASNPYMLDWLTRLGERKAAGLPTRHESGRWLRPEEIHD